MSFFQNVNKMESEFLEIEPITWGNFQILAIDDCQKDNPKFLFDCMFGCMFNTGFYKSWTEGWQNLMRGILTNDINLVRDNVNKVDILGALRVVTNDPNNRVKFFSVKEAKKYSNDEIINYLRNIYDEKSLNATWFGSQKAITSRGSFFTTVPSFDGEQPAKIEAKRVKMLNPSILFDKIRIIGLPIPIAAPKKPHRDVGGMNADSKYERVFFEPDSKDKYINLDEAIDLQLLFAVASGNLGAVKDITKSYPNVSTIQPVVTENFNELFLDLVYEANRLGFYEIARCLRDVEKAQGKYPRLSLSELQKQQGSGLKLGEFVKLDIPMEEE